VERLTPEEIERRRDEFEGEKARAKRVREEAGLTRSDAREIG
jgi:hypothetical protein